MELDEYYDEAIDFVKSHYENFPVISVFVKKPLRKHVAAVYQFARQADDIADEGDLSKDERIKRLNDYEFSLKKSLAGSFENNFWKILRATIEENNLTESDFFNLLSAFKQDVWKNRYNNFDDLLDYCKRSANPVGRIILNLNEITDKSAIEYSDNICSALQLANFYQDVSVDILKGRIYIPEDELEKFSINEKDIMEKRFSNQFADLMKYEVDRCKEMFLKGRNLLAYLPLRLRLQILVTIKGGEAILAKIEELNYNVIETRPTLSKLDFIKLFSTALIFWR